MFKVKVQQSMVGHDAGHEALERRALLRGVAALTVIAPFQAARAEQVAPASQAALLRIKIVTIGAHQPEVIAKLYATWFGYAVRETGKISKDLASSWGAPKNAGRTYVLLGSAGSPDVFLRVVGIDPVPGYIHSTTSGWNGFEFIVDDVQALYQRLQISPFKPRRPPSPPVEAFPTVLSMDVDGPAEETLFLTCETGDRSKSYLPLPGALVGRSHLVWLSGPNILKVRDWYAESFSMAKKSILDRPVPGATHGETMPNTLLLMKERGNFLQFEEHPAQLQSRSHGDGQLPPGNAMASFSVSDLDALKLPFITAPSPLYGKNRTATVLDPNGNRVELIEESREERAR